MSNKAINVIDNDAWQDVAVAMRGIMLDARKQIISNMRAKGKIVTGRTANSLEVNVDSYVGAFVRGTITGSRHFPVVETGRRQGKVPANMFDIIYEWSLDKGIAFDKEYKRRSFSYLVSRKIRKFGTLDYRRGGRTDIYTPVINNTLKELKDHPEKLRADALVSTTQTKFRGNAVHTAINIHF